MSSAKTAVPSSVKTMKAPRRPSGFSRISRIPTSRKRERVRGTAVRCASWPSTALALEIISAFLPLLTLTIADAGIEVCVAKIHHEIQQQSEGSPDQIHALHHWIIQANQRLHEETPHPWQPEDGLDDH